MDNVQADSLKRGAIKLFSTTTFPKIFSTLITLAPGRRANVCHPLHLLIEWEAAMKISLEFDGTTRELIADLAWTIYRSMGYTAPSFAEKPMYFFDSQHPQEKACVWAAEQIYEKLTGDSPEYLDDDVEDDSYHGR
jgi:hypothetical protein